LERGENNEIRRATPNEILPLFLNQTVRPFHRQKATNMLEMIEHMISRVPIFCMKCNMDPSAALLSYQTMCEVE
jgi:hypothetical protein